MLTPFCCTVGSFVEMDPPLHAQMDLYPLGVLQVQPVGGRQCHLWFTPMALECHPGVSNGPCELHASNRVVLVQSILAQPTQAKVRWAGHEVGHEVDQTRILQLHLL